MYIRKSCDPKIELCGIPASTDDQFVHWPLSTNNNIGLHHFKKNGARKFITFHGS